MEGSVFRVCVAGHDIFFPVVEVDAVSGEHVEDGGILLFQTPYFGIGSRKAVKSAAVGSGPYAFDRADDQQGGIRFCSVQGGVDSGKIVLQVVVFGIPGGLVQDAGGIIPFPFSLHGVPGQVRAAQVDAKQRLPVADIFVGFKIHLPAGAAVKLGENPFFIQLSCHGIHLFCGPVALIVFSKNVYAGVVHIFIEAHEGALHDGLAAEGILV